MDKELMNLLVELKIDAQAFQTLVDTILDNCRLGYDNESLVISSDAEIFAIIKAFRNDEYLYRLKRLKNELAAKEKKMAEAENKTPGEA